MATNPLTASNDLATYEVLSNGSAINDTYQVESIKVSKYVNKVSSCEIVLVDGDPATENFPISDSSDFLPGATIEIQMGYESKNQTVFKGIVTSQGLRVVQGSSGPKLEVVCKDEAIKMTIGRKNTTYQKEKDSDVWSSIIGNYSGLSSSITATSAEVPEIVQYYATDWDFVLSRAEFNGMVVITDNNQVTIANPDDETDEVLEVTYGYDILDFDADLDSLSQYSSIKSQSWDLSSQAVITGSGSVSDDGQGNVTSATLAGVVGLSDYLLQSTAPIDSGSLTTWASAQATKSKYAKIRGSVSFQGSALAAPGKLINIAGMGDRFNGKAYMSEVNHSIESGNWVTEITMGLSAEWFAAKVAMQAPLAAGVLPGIQGLQNGTVKQINEDPDGQFRVLVNVPIIDASGDGIWARLSTFYATNNAGAFFYPEVGDEVILGFLNDDPRFPIILGSVYSSSNKQAPYTPDENNTTKAIVTNSQLKMVYDDENKVITITTPAGNQMVWSDQDSNIMIKDQNENSIEMSSSGITIKSASNMTLQASESISIEAGTTLTAEGTESVSISGGTISASADESLSLSGGMEATLSGGTEVSISGAMVMIN